MKTIRSVFHAPGRHDTTVNEHAEDGFRSSGHSGSRSRRCMSGWGSRHGSRDSKHLIGQPVKLEGKTYDEIKAQCLQEKRLFADPDFPANNSSIFPGRRSSQVFEWKRPHVSNFQTNGVGPTSKIVTIMPPIWLLFVIWDTGLSKGQARLYCNCTSVTG